MSRLDGSVGVRLALAFLTVALAAITVFAALTIVSARNEVSGLTDRHHEDDLAATAIAAGDAYQRAGGWATADLAGAAAVAARSQATLTIVDAGGEVVAAPTDALASMMMQMHGMAAVDTPCGDPVSAERPSNTTAVITRRAFDIRQLCQPAVSYDATDPFPMS